MANALLDFLQGASNSAAANVSAPVDGIAWLLRKAGINVDRPVMGSDWMRERGLTAEPTNKLAGILGESVGGVLPMVTAAKAPQIAQGLLQAERNLAAPRTLNPQTGAILWHGSPHKFDAFDSSKIGTGEGAQAYGHGLYLADSPDVATTYKNLMAGKVDKVTSFPTADGARVVGSYPRMVATDIKKTYGGNVKAALDDAIRTDADPEYISAVKSFLGKNVDSFDIKKMREGSLYKVDLPDEHIAKMLDWDKPLSKQSPEVQKAVKQVVPPYTDDMVRVINQKINEASILSRTSTDPSVKKAAAQEHARLLNSLRTRQSEVEGKALMSYLGSPVQASEALKNAGIPGIRYLDGGSRGTGAGTSNYVVFPGNEGLLSILERNGQPLK